MPLRWETISLALPELILVSAATLILVGGAFWRSRSAWSVLGIVAILAAAAALARTFSGFQHPMLEVVEGPFLVDPMALVGRNVALTVGALLILIFARRAGELQGGEFPALLLMLTAGLSLSAIAGNIVLLFVTLELISIPSYVLLFLGRNQRESAEATLKYFLLSILSSAVFLMGLSLLFAVTGTVDLSGMAHLEGIDDPSTLNLLSLSMGLVLFGLAFRLAAVPCHFYAPDVYQATTNANAGLLAVVPKFAGSVALLRFTGLGLINQASIGWQVLVVVAMLSMTMGNVAALWQSNLRRMMAYSSIAHAGYLLIGIAVGLNPRTPDAGAWFQGLSASLLYVIVYALATLGAFAVLAELSSGAEEVSHLRQLHGLVRRRPGLAAALAVCMFSLSGLPPLAGFWGKLELIGGALQASSQSSSPTAGNAFLWLSIVAMVNAAIAATYYLRVIAAAFFFSDSADQSAVPGFGWWGSLASDSSLTRKRESRPKDSAEPVWQPKLASSTITREDGIPCASVDKSEEYGAAGLAAACAAVATLAIGLVPGPIVGHVRMIGESLVSRASDGHRTHKLAEDNHVESLAAFDTGDGSSPSREKP